MLCVFAAFLTCVVIQNCTVEIGAITVQLASKMTAAELVKTMRSSSSCGRPVAAKCGTGQETIDNALFFPLAPPPADIMSVAAAAASAPTAVLTRRAPRDLLVVVQCRHTAGLTYVTAEGVATWYDTAVAYVSTLPDADNVEVVFIYASDRPISEPESEKLKQLKKLGLLVMTKAEAKVYLSAPLRAAYVSEVRSCQIEYVSLTLCSCVQAIKAAELDCNFSIAFWSENKTSVCVHDDLIVFDILPCFVSPLIIFYVDWSCEQGSSGSVPYSERFSSSFGPNEAQSAAVRL
jgi:hypothetical protein